MSQPDLRLPWPFRIIAGAMGLAFVALPVGMLFLLWGQRTGPPLPMKLGGTVFLGVFVLVAILLPLRIAIVGRMLGPRDLFTQFARSASAAATPPECPSCGAPLEPPAPGDPGVGEAVSLLTVEVRCAHCGTRVPLRAPRRTERQKKAGNAR